MPLCCLVAQQGWKGKWDHKVAGAVQLDLGDALTGLPPWASTSQHEILGTTQQGRGLEGDFRVQVT